MEIQRVLGENLYRLRTARGYSQERVADAIGVSRQSVSKWETGGAVPELDKLMALAQFFGVSLDALVQGSASDVQTESPAREAAESGRTPLPMRKIVGTILLCTGAVIFLVLLFFAGLGGLFFALPFLLCGLLCLILSRRVGLACAWAVYFSVDLYLQFATGASRGVVLHTAVYLSSGNHAILLIAWSSMLLLAALILWTAVSFRDWRFSPTTAQAVLLVLGAVILVVFHLPLPIFSKGWIHLIRASGGSYVLRILFALWDWCFIVLFVVLLICALGLLRGKNRKKDK